MTKIKQIEEFILYQKSLDKSALTMKSYRLDLYSFAGWFYKINGELLKLRKITPTDIRQYKQYLISCEYKPNTINRRLVSLRHFLSWAWSTKRISYQFPLPKFVRQNKTAPKWLNKVDQNSLLRHIERYGKKRDITIVKLLLNTGIRVHELCNLKWNNIEISERKGNVVIYYGKGNKYREIPLNNDARNILLSIDYKKHTGKAEAVFIGQKGALSSRGIQLMFKRLFKNSNFISVTPHQLRHTFCKNLIDAGVSLDKVAALAGHESLETTKIYCTPSLSDLAEAVEKIGEDY
jgi:integrase/recombinase XerC